MNIIVAGIGNLLMGDDGLGIHAIHAMKEAPRISGITILDVGTSALALAADLAQADFLLLIDAIRAGGQPGVVHQFSGDTIAPPKSPRSLHEYGVSHVLAQMDSVRRPREIIVVGLEPGALDFGMNLSDPVAQALPALVEEAWQIVNRWRSLPVHDPRRHVDQLQESIP